MPHTKYLLAHNTPAPMGCCKLFFGVVGSLQIGAREVCSLQNGITQRTVTQCRLSETSLREIRSLEVRMTYCSAFLVCSCQIGTHQIRLRQIGITQDTIAIVV